MLRARPRKKLTPISEASIPLLNKAATPSAKECRPYMLIPNLSENLGCNAETRIVAGTPIKAIAETTYTLTA